MRAVAVPVTAYILARLGESKEALHRVREGEELPGARRLADRAVAPPDCFDFATAWSHYRETAQTMFREMGLPFWLEQTEVVMRRLDT
jgi:hypothetical protein